MRPLVRVRQSTPFDPRFLRKSPLLWPLEEAARRLGGCDDFPLPEALDRVFAVEPPVRFEKALPRSRRRENLEAGALYDGRIALHRRVPTRARCWHDFMNALVWGTFPASKSELHARQHWAIASRITPGATRLPPTRTRELDALALLDEGGVIVSADDPERLRATLRAHSDSLKAEIESGRADALVFGHAIFESLVLGVSPAAVAAITVARDGKTGDRANALTRIDLAMAAALRDTRRCSAPNELTRVDLADLTPQAQYGWPHFSAPFW